MQRGAINIIDRAYQITATTRKRKSILNFVRFESLENSRDFPNARSVVEKAATALTIEAIIGIVSRKRPCCKIIPPCV
jgi:hypothetical protein